MRPPSLWEKQVSFWQELYVRCAVVASVSEIEFLNVYSVYDCGHAAMLDMMIDCSNGGSLGGAGLMSHLSREQAPLCITDNTKC